MAIYILARKKSPQFVNFSPQKQETALERSLKADSLLFSLYDFFYFIGFEAGATNFIFSGNTFIFSAHFVQIGVKTAFASVHGMGAMIPYERSFPTNIAYS
jgi:hypothetical protein